MSSAGESDEINNPKGILNTGDDALQQSIYDFFPGLVYVYDLDKKQLRYMNKRITDSLGYSYDDIKDWKQDIKNLIFKDDYELVEKELDKFHDLKENDAHGYRCRLNRKEGDYIHFQVTGRVLRRNDKGRAESVLFIAQDINEQIRSADEAKAFAELMDDTENLLQFATWSWDGITNREVWSKGVYSLLDMDPKDVGNKMTTAVFLDHVVADDRKRIDHLYDQAIENKQEFLSYEYNIKTRDDRLKILHSNIKFRYTNDILVGALGINRDVTEKSKLLNSLLGYREMIMEKEAFLGQGSWEIDLTTNTTIWSDGMFALYGYDPEMDKSSMIINEEVYRRHINEIDFERGREKRENNESENSYVWQYQIITQQGEPRQLETFGKVLRDATGTPIKVFGTTRDVTKVVNYEKELERKIAELNRSNKDLEEFAYIASHDMHEPLRKVHSFADRLKAKYSDNMEDEARGYLDRILAATQNARLMIDGLMEFSRLSRNGFGFEKVDLNDLIKEVLSDLEVTIDETKTKIEVEPLPAFEIIRIQMKQLLSNVILNAIKFRKSDVTPVITIKAKKLARTEVDNLHLDIGKEYYKLIIKDNGIGFEQEYADTIFQMFQRLNSKSEYAGSGIGLALCKKITDNHQGLIQANSALGQGTVISVILPETHS